MNKIIAQSTLLKAAFYTLIITLAAALLSFVIWEFQGQLTVDAYSTILFLTGLVCAVIGGAVYFGGYYGGRYMYLGKVPSLEAQRYDKSPKVRAGSGNAAIFMYLALSGVLAIAASLLIYVL